MAHSLRCKNLTTRWNSKTQQCVQCLPLPLKPGYEITPNCGYDDGEGRHEPPTKHCKNGYYNTGSKYTCTPCSECPPGHRIVRPCNVTADTLCDTAPISRAPATNIPVTEPATLNSVTSAPTAPTYPKHSSTYITPPPTQSVSAAAWAVPLAILISILAALSAYVVSRKRKRAMSFKRRPSYNQGFAPLTGSNASDVDDMLNAGIMSAPLQTVLDNLDVLEELVILLDPEGHGRKNTKHLASHCAFSATWITYIYSMKDSKSPLKAVLEGVTCKHPDWTVGHLAKLLKLMERNDAIAPLAKLGVNKTDV